MEDGGRVLIYEGHDIPRQKGGCEPKSIDQPMTNPSGKPTQNGLFYQAAKQYTSRQKPPEIVKVYEKIHTGIWVYNGLFKLIDAWQQRENNRDVFKFKLEISEEPSDIPVDGREIDHSRLIPASVKLTVWKRDKGRCVICGSKDNLHLDHIIPFSRGGSSLVAENIQILCARHNLTKKDNIE